MNFGWTTFFYWQSFKSSFNTRCILDLQVSIIFAKLRIDFRFHAISYLTACITLVLRINQGQKHNNGVLCYSPSPAPLMSKCISEKDAFSQQFSWYLVRSSQIMFCIKCEPENFGLFVAIVQEEIQRASFLLLYLCLSLHRSFYYVYVGRNEAER